MGAVIVTEEIIFYAFKFALGKGTGTVCDVVECLIANWDGLEPNTRTKIRNELIAANARYYSRTEDAWDKELWTRLLDHDNPAREGGTVLTK